MAKEKISEEEYLKSVPEDKKFWCADGKVFRNLEDLEKGVKHMGLKTFSEHVNKSKNDFSKWIYDVIGDVKLSEKLRVVTSKSGTEKEIKARVSSIKRRAKS